MPILNCTTLNICDELTALGIEDIDDPMVRDEVKDTLDDLENTADSQEHDYGTEHIADVLYLEADYDNTLMVAVQADTPYTRSLIEAFKLDSVISYVIYLISGESGDRSIELVN